MRTCQSCPRACVVEREREAGFCGADQNIKVASYCIHRGEEPVISGTRGSGTIFFSHCNLQCVFCQNYDISQQGKGEIYSQEQLVDCMVSLQENGVHNINLVSPTHYSYLLPNVIRIAQKNGLRIPIVYNSNGYDDVNIVRSLGGLIDIYMPDMKYADDTNAKKYSNCPNYSVYAKKAITEMFNHVGAFICDENGIAQRGVLVRHLVLPGNVSGSIAVLDFLRSVSPHIYVSIMSQYHPCFKAFEYPELARTIRTDEYEQVTTYAESLGFDSIFIQAMESHDQFLPNFDQEDPFRR